MARAAVFMLPDGTPLPGKRVICRRCDGTGHHVNPAIDGNGITQSEMDELGEEFFDDYMGGVYDVTCSECSGNKVIVEGDELAMTPDQQAEYHEYLEDQAQQRAEQRLRDQGVQF